MRTLHIILSTVACPAVVHFSILSYKRYYFRKNVSDYEMCISIFSKNLPEVFVTLKRNERDVIENVRWSLCKVPIENVRWSFCKVPIENLCWSFCKVPIENVRWSFCKVPIENVRWSFCKVPIENLCWSLCKVPIVLVGF